MMTNLFSIFSNEIFLFTAALFALITKSYLLYILFIDGFSLRSPKGHYPWIFLNLVLFCSIIVDLGWLIKLTNLIDKESLLIFTKFAWAASIVLYQSLAFFTESLIDKKFQFTLRRKIYLLMDVLLISVLLYLGIFEPNPQEGNIKILLDWLKQSVPIFLIFGVLVPSLVITLFKRQDATVPKILKKQLKVLILGFYTPKLFFDVLHIYQFKIFTKTITNNYAVAGFSTLFVAFAALYCTKKVMYLRFLNFKSHVQSQKKYSFINNFKDILEQLSQATNSRELIHITKTFFKEYIEIATNKTILCIRNKDSNFLETDKTKNNIIESFISNQGNESVLEFLRQSKILIYDEIEFSNFYEENEIGNTLVKFLNSINANIFIPIFQKQNIIAYIIIERDSQNNQIYSNMERDEMLVFTSYLTNIIDLLQHKNLESLLQQEKELKEELYHKHQEINQYKESIRSFLKRGQNRKIGLLFYKNRKFTFGNQHAKEIIPYNINVQEGHLLTQDLKKIAKQVEDYNSTQTCYSKDILGNKILITGIPNLEDNNNIILMVYYPDISDIIKEQIDLLKDPSKWDYLLYLETTKSGQLINQLVPGSGEILLNFKINLLKIALTKKALLLELPEEDLLPTVEIIHHASLRDKLHVLKLQTYSKNFDLAIKLFGINPIFGINEQQPILQKLDGNGTLFIQNIHFVDLETQEYLAEFIKYGFYKIFKSDQKVISDIRIVCSTNQDLSNLVAEGKFSKTLFEELNKTSLCMPSLLTLSEEELKNLAQGFTEQAMQADEFKNLLELTDKEKINLINKKPVSLQEFKEKIQQTLIEKSKKNNIYEETQFDPAYNISDPKLIEAARLGKHALKDPKMLNLLWDKFQNQNKIATFLGVNRSSVHRRLKEYKIGE